MTQTETPDGSTSRGVVARLTAFGRRHVGELARFGSVGAIAYVVDVGVFNLLRFGPGEVLGHKPITAKVVAVVVAMVVSYVGNRYWTFSDRRTTQPLRELVAFVVANGIGMGAAVGCLAFSHYVLNLTSPLADNISANVVGLGLGTAIRFVGYRQFVFTGDKKDAPVAPEPAPHGTTGAAALEAPRPTVAVD